MADHRYPFVAMDAYFNTDNGYSEGRVVKVYEFGPDRRDSIEAQDARRWITLPTVLITEDETTLNLYMNAVETVISMTELKAINEQVKKIAEERGWNV